ncbi:protein of unknown function [Pararobbsia alpina]
MPLTLSCLSQPLAFASLITAEAARRSCTSTSSSFGFAASCARAWGWMFLRICVSSGPVTDASPTLATTSSCAKASIGAVNVMAHAAINAIFMLVPLAKFLGTLKKAAAPGKVRRATPLTRCFLLTLPCNDFLSRSFERAVCCPRSTPSLDLDS